MTNRWIVDRARTLLSLLILDALLTGCGAASDPVTEPGLGEVPAGLAGASIVETGQLLAVGQAYGRAGCSATLIDDDVALAAGHCFCNEVAPFDCRTRGTFVLRGVFPVDDPATPGNESTVRTDVTFAGDVAVHPGYGNDGWLYNDLAVIHLDQLASSRVVGVTPLFVEPEAIPHVGDLATLVGYGPTDSDDGNCTHAAGVKRKATTAIDIIANHGGGGVILRFDDSAIHTCAGDSGGPAIAHNRVIGVSSNGNRASNSGYTATYSAQSWLRGEVCEAFDPDRPDASLCTPYCRCSNGHGDCDSDADCAPGTTCHFNVGASYGLPASYDVCVTRPPPPPPPCPNPPHCQEF